MLDWDDLRFFLAVARSGSLSKAAKSLREAGATIPKPPEATDWGGYSGYDGWFDRVNNAALGVLAAYAELVPDFERLHRHLGGDFDRFYAEVSRLAALPKAERRAKLAATP